MPKRIFALLTTLMAVIGCQTEPGDQPGGIPSGTSEVFLVVSDSAAAVGSRVVVRIGLIGGDPLAATIGTLGFDPARLRYLGQPGAIEPFTIVNHADADRGRIRTASLALPSLGTHAGTFVFEVRGAGYREGLSYRLEEASGPDARAAGWLDHVRGAVVAPLDVPLDEPRMLSVRDWAAALHPDLLGAKPFAVPGAGLIFGDATLDGVVNIIDAYGAANLGVGNLPLITDATKDYVVAANVFPFNLPGLGEAADPIPPGLEVDGSRLITILDAVAIANDAVGNDQPIVREPIPGRTSAATRAILTGIIAANRTLTRDTVYELQGVVKVAGGVTLTIDAGTRLEGDPATRGTLMALRGGRIEASGTFLEPIVMTCAAATPTPGCWGGVVLNGLALINNDVSGPGTIVVCPEKQTIGSTELYGGCLTQNSSGTLRYVRIEHAGGPIASGATPGLALLGVGMGTAVEFVQVHGSAGAGLFISGGSVNLRHVQVTGSADAGIAWDDGWVGLGQFLVVQQPAGGGPGLRGSNYAVNPNAGPRSKPQLYHATILATPGGAAGSAGVLLTAGSGLILRSSIVAGFPGAGLDVNDPATCALLGGTDLVIEADYFHLNGEPFSSDSDCADEVGYGTNPVRGNLVADPQLIAPFNTATLDVRLANGSPAGSGALAATGDPFFDGVAGYFGAAEPANLQGNRIPWFTGWSRGWSGSTP